MWLVFNHNANVYQQYIKIWLCNTSSANTGHSRHQHQHAAWADSVSEGTVLSVELPMVSHTLMRWNSPNPIPDIPWPTDIWCVHAALIFKSNGSVRYSFDLMHLTFTQAARQREQHRTEWLVSRPPHTHLPTNIPLHVCGTEHEVESSLPPCL